jgi:nucleoside-diphosphate-sugar epimerase
MSERVLVTGATGFVGRAVCQHLASQGYRVRGVVRGSHERPTGVEFAQIPDLAKATSSQWAELLDDVQVVIHCAALVHQMQGVPDPDAYYRINTAATAMLAEAAAGAGVRRFIFLSTVKVLGEYSEPGRPFRADDPANPQDDYARSKWLAEQALTAVGNRTGMDAVILRPPLIYGPGVGGNFESLMWLVKKGVPLPLGAVNNQRSLLAIENLLDVLSLCVHRLQPLAGNYLVSDGQDVSTRELVCELALAQGVRAMLLPVPVSILRLAGWCLGRKAAVERLCADLCVNIDVTRSTLDWEPRYTLSECCKLQAII